MNAALNHLAVAGLGLLTGACSLGGSPAATASPTPAVTATVTAPPPPSASPVPSPSPSPVPGSAAIKCDSVPTADAPLILVRLQPAESLVRDITDPASPKTRCTLTGAVLLQLISPTKVGYPSFPDPAAPERKIFVGDLSTGGSRIVATFSNSGTFGSGNFAFSADGTNLTYLSGDSTKLDWHLVRSGTDTVLVSYPAVPGRGVDPENDDLFLGFSPDGRFVAFIQTFTKGPDDSTLGLVVRNVGDGSVAFSRADGTMATWGGAGATLLYRTRAGAVFRWAGGAAVQVSPSLRWIRPRPAPDGGLVIYELRDGAGLGHVYTMDVSTGATSQLSVAGRGAPTFLSAKLVWYRGERLCGPDECGLGGPSTFTDVSYVNDVRGGSEATSSIAGVESIWPRVTAGRGP